MSDNNKDDLIKNADSNLGIDVSSDETKNGPDHHRNRGDGATMDNDTGGGAHNGSKIGSALGTDGHASNAGGRAEGSADGRNNENSNQTSL